MSPLLEPPSFLQPVRRALSPRRFPYARFAAALALGAAGGWLFATANLPLPWMLGSMAACTLGALVRAPIAAPGVVRPPMTMVIGVLLGAGFSPDIVDQFVTWTVTMAGLTVFILAAGLASVTYLRRFAKLDATTAYFAGMPGGLTEMVILGEQHGGDQRVIALMHSARILLIVLTLPFLVQWLSGVDFGPRSRLGVSVMEAPWTSELWLLATAVAGAVLGRLLRIRAAYLLGPMLVSAAVHLLGWTTFIPPREIINTAQLVLGASIGCSFAGTAPREILRILLVALGSTAILLGTTLAFAWGVSRVSPHDIVPLMLAYSPGGLAEMSLIALALQIEVAFVAAHHVARVLLVMVGADAIFSRLAKHEAP